MADELWIVGDEESHAWSVDAKGKVTTNDDYPIDGERVVIGVADSPLTQKQADGIRGLICDLRKDGVLDFNPAVGVQYPQRTTVLNVEQAMRYLHAWTDDCDEEWHTSADAGLCSEIPWEDGEVVEPPDQSIHQQQVTDDLTSSADVKRERARNDKGHFIADAPAPPEDEAWVEVAGGPQAIEEKPAGGDSQEQQGEVTHGGDSTEDMPVMQILCAPGEKNQAVETWQAVCNEIVMANDSIDMEPIGVDGSFGEQTEALTRVVQEALGVPVTGLCDQATWDAVSNG